MDNAMQEQFDPNEPMTDCSSLSDREKDLLKFAVQLEHGTPMFKIRHFVGDAQITAYAKYRQLMLELRTREELIETMTMNLAKLHAEAAVISEEHDKATDVQKAVIIWDLRSKRNEIIKVQRRLNLAYEERQRYLDAVEEMYSSGAAYLPDGTDLRKAVTDPVITERLEREHWIYRLGKQAALDMIAYGHIGTGNLEAITMMDEATAVETMRLAITFSHTMKTALGKMESEIIKSINEGSIGPTMKIESHLTNKELEA